MTPQDKLQEELTRLEGVNTTLKLARTVQKQAAELALYRRLGTFEEAAHAFLFFGAVVQELQTTKKGQAFLERCGARFMEANRRTAEQHRFDEIIENSLEKEWLEMMNDKDERLQ